MIYKSRNGIGIRVMLITLFFFVMLTNATDDVNLYKENLKKCGFKPWKPDFDGMSTKKEIEDAALYATEKFAEMKKEHQRWEYIYLGVFCFFSVSICILCPMYVVKAQKQYLTKNTTKTCDFCFVVIAIIIFFVSTYAFMYQPLRYWKRYRGEKNACKYLTTYINNEKKFYIKNIEEAEIMVEEKFDTDGIAETKVKVKVSEVEKNEFSEETKISMESAITITDTLSSAATELETYYEDYSVTSEFNATITDTSSSAATELERYYEDYSVTSEFNASNETHKKKDEKKGCLLDNIDLNRFIYAMVLVFALFAIYTFCNFEEEEETGEITEV